MRRSIERTLAGFYLWVFLGLAVLALALGAEPWRGWVPVVDQINAALR